MSGKTLRLCFSFGVVFSFVYLAPLIDRFPWIAPLVEFIDDREIDAGALYYTEIEEFSDAELQIRNIMDY